MTITVSELKRQLEIFDDDAELYFSGLDFNRVKPLGADVVQVEFKQNVFRDNEGMVHIDNL